METLESLQLHDIHLPNSPDIWPLAMGWWLLFTLVFFFGVWVVLKLKKRLNTKRRQKIIFDKISELEKSLRDNPNNKTLAKFNVLLRQLAVTHFPRSETANLTGVDWLHFLDESGHTNDFSRGAGRILLSAPYQSGDLQNLNIEEFIPLIKKWVSTVLANKKGVNTKSVRLINSKPLKSRGV